MVSHTLSFESILVIAIGVIIIFLFTSLLVFVSFTPDPKTTPDLDSEMYPNPPLELRNSQKAASEIERNFDVF